jgi:YD repeat-containing protein
MVGLVMTDRDRYRLRGPVQSVRSEVVYVDSPTGDSEPRRGPTLTFDREGREEGRQPDEEPTISTIDEEGLRTTVGPRAPFVPRQPVMDYGVCFDGAARSDVLTRYDAHQRPAEIVHRDSAQKALYRIQLSYDDDGRIVREQVLIGDLCDVEGSWVPGRAGAGTQPLTAEQREEAAAAFGALMPDGVFSTREYVYDDRGRVAQLLERMALVSESRHSYIYDAHDNILEAHCEESHREVAVDDEGNLITSNESSDESWQRYEYRYDDRGNFIERIVSSSVAPDRDFHRSSVERRTITYFD